MPELEAIQEEMPDKVRVLGIQTSGSLQRGAAVLSESGAHYASVLDPGLGRDFDVRLIPYTVVVRPDGRLGVAIHGAGDRELFRRQALAMETR